MKKYVGVSLIVVPMETALGGGVLPGAHQAITMVILGLMWLGGLLLLVAPDKTNRF